MKISTTSSCENSGGDIYDIPFLTQSPAQNLCPKGCTESNCEEHDSPPDLTSSVSGSQNDVANLSEVEDSESDDVLVEGMECATIPGKQDRQHIFHHAMWLLFTGNPAIADA